MVSEWINLSRTVNPSTRIRKYENSKELILDGRIKQFKICFPSGTDNLVVVSCGVNEKFYVPDVAECEECLSFDVDIPVCKTDRVWAEISNYSDTKTFRVGVYVLFEHQ